MVKVTTMKDNRLLTLIAFYSVPRNTCTLYIRPSDQTPAAEETWQNTHRPTGAPTVQYDTVFVVTTSHHLRMLSSFSNKVTS